MDLDNKKSPDRLLDGQFRALGDETDEQGGRRLLHSHNTTNLDELTIEQRMQFFRERLDVLRRTERPQVTRTHRPDAAGLSTCHKCRKIDDDLTAKVVLYPQGSLLTVSKNRKNPYEGVSRDGMRGEITEFSVKSRRRLMQSMAKVNKGDLPQFITLTYPAEYSDDFRDWKDDLRRFNQRLEYRFPFYAAFWKLEFQKRGAPHFHLLAWGLPRAHMKDFIAMMWYKTVGSGDEKHLKAGTQISRIKSWRGVMAYASKYLGKTQECNENPPGRFWGIFNRTGIPWSDEVIYFISQGQAVLAMRYMRRYAGIRARDYSSLSIYINSPPDWERALELSPSERSEEVRVF